MKVGDAWLTTLVLNSIVTTVSSRPSCGSGSSLNERGQLPGRSERKDNPGLQVRHPRTSTAPTPSQPRDSGQTRSPNQFHGLSLTWFGTDKERANSQGCQQEPLVKASATVPEPGNFRDRAVARAPRLCNLAAVEGKSGAQHGGLWLRYVPPSLQVPTLVIPQTTSSLLSSLFQAQACPPIFKKLAATPVGCQPYTVKGDEVMDMVRWRGCSVAERPSSNAS